MAHCQVLIAGARGGTNVGDSLYHGAIERGIAAELIDTRELGRGPWLLSKVLWRVFDHRQPGLARFSRKAVRAASELRPQAFIAVGFAVLKHDAVRAIRAQGVRTLAFLTDDPWNPSQRSRWSQRALPEYDVIVTPRRAIIDDLRGIGCRDVRYLPFGYDPRLFYPDPSDPSLASDVIFVGGADADRAPWIGSLLRSGHEVALYGSYWDRFSQTQGRSRGQASADVIRRATSAAKVAVCLVRRSNRDGHVMRSLEIPAVGTCMLAEDTEEHRALFGPDGECVLYFQSIEQMRERLDWLLSHDAERARLAAAARERLLAEDHSYAHRIEQMLALALETPTAAARR